MHLYVHCSIITIPSLWKQPMYPLINEWIKKMWYLCIYKGILLSYEKNNEILSFVIIWMDLISIMLQTFSHKINNIMGM